MTFCCDNNMTLYLWWRCGVMRVRLWSNKPTDQSVTLWKPAVARERCFTFTIKDQWYISSYCLLLVVKVEAGRFFVVAVLFSSHVSGVDVLPCWQPCADVYQPGIGCQYHGVDTAGEGLLVDRKAVTDVKCKKIICHRETKSLGLFSICQKVSETRGLEPLFQTEMPEDSIGGWRMEHYQIFRDVSISKKKASC